MIRALNFLSFIVCLSYIFVYFHYRDIAEWIFKINLRGIMAASVVVCAFSSLSIIITYLFIPSAARMAADGFYFSIAGVVFSLGSGVIGLVARYDSDFARLDIELSLFEFDPAEMFLYCLIASVCFLSLRILSDAVTKQ